MYGPKKLRSSLSFSSFPPPMYGPKKLVCEPAANHGMDARALPRAHLCRPRRRIRFLNAIQEDAHIDRPLQQPPPPPPPPSMRSPRQERVHMLASRRALLCMCTSSPRTGSSFHSSRRTWRPSRRRELIRMWMARPIRATGLRRSLSAASISCPRPHVHCALVSALIREDGMGCHCTSVPVRVLLLNQELFIKQPSSRSSGT